MKPPDTRRQHATEQQRLAAIRQGVALVQQGIASGAIAIGALPPALQDVIFLLGCIDRRDGVIELLEPQPDKNVQLT